MPIPDPEQQIEQVRSAVEYIRSRTGLRPRVGLVVGTGLAGVTELVTTEAVIPYGEIPHFPHSTVAGHPGRLIVGRVDGMPVVAMQGRIHLYEGYTALQVTFAVRVMAKLGVDVLLLTNACGGMNPHFSRSDLMLVTDHINLQGVNPLEGPNVDAWGPRFPDMSEVYDPELRRLVEEEALEGAIPLRQGVYAAVTGPSLETRAEYRFLRQIGADVVGMSTVPEAIAARHMGMRCLAVSVITDECFPDALEPVTIDDVLAAAAEAEPNLSRLIRAVLARIARPDSARA